MTHGILVAVFALIIPLSGLCAFITWCKHPSKEPSLVCTDGIELGTFFSMVSQNFISTLL